MISSCEVLCQPRVLKVRYAFIELTSAYFLNDLQAVFTATSNRRQPEVLKRLGDCFEAFLSPMAIEILTNSFFELLVLQSEVVLPLHRL